MLYRLAYRSFRKQARNYLIYFFSMVLAVTIFYCFSALTYDRALVVQANQDIRISGVLNFAQTIVIAILLFFMLSANHFFVDRRGEEIGIYQLFGLKKWKIICFFLTETLFLGLVSLVVGIVLGIVFSKLFSMILVKAMALTAASDFFVSWRSIQLTSGVMLFVLIIVALRTSWLVYHYQLTSFAADNELDSRKFKLRWWQKLLGWIGLVLLVLCYLSAIKTTTLVAWLADHGNRGLGTYFWAMLLTFTLGVAGTYLFFGWSLRLLLAGLAANKPFNYRQLNALLVGNLRERLLRNWRTTGVIAIMTSISLLLIGLAVSLFSVSLKTLSFSDPVSYQVAAEDYQQFLSIVADHDGRVTENQTLNFKAVGGRLTSAIANDTAASSITIVNLLALSNYQEYRQVNSHLKLIRLEHKTDVVLLDSIQNQLQQFVTYQSEMALADQQVEIVKVLPDHLGSDRLRYSGPTLIVTDELYQEISGYSYQLQAVNTSSGNVEQLATAVSQEFSTRWDFGIVADYQWVDQQLTGAVYREPVTASLTAAQYRLNLSNQFLNWRSARRQLGLVVYVSAFIGLISLITTASILALRQLAEAPKAKKNYQLLLTLGIPRKQVRRMILQENGFVFLPVLVLTILNSFFGFYLLLQYISNANFLLPNVFLVILAAIYGLFYVGTVTFYRRAVGV